MKELLAAIINVCSELCAIVFPVVCNSSPEGFLPSCEVQPVENKLEKLEVKRNDTVVYNVVCLYRMVMVVFVVMPSHCCCVVGTAVRRW